MTGSTHLARNVCPARAVRAGASRSVDTCCRGARNSVRTTEGASSSRDWSARMTKRRSRVGEPWMLAAHAANRVLLRTS